MYGEGKKRRLPAVINRGNLKRLAAATMLVDHITLAFLERIPDEGTGWVLALSSDLLYAIDRLGRGIGRQAFVIFAFFLAEGFVHTGNRKRYLLRLILTAAAAALPFHLLFFTGPIGGTLHDSANTMVTLCLGLLAMWAVELGRKKGKPWSRILAACGAALCCLAAQVLPSDYGAMGVAAVLIFYLFRGIPYAGPAIVYVTMSLWNGSEIFALPGCVLLCLYNGEKGRSSGRFFYLFYPLHLLAIWIVRRMIVGY